MTDRRAGRIPHVGKIPRARRKDGGWYRKRSDAGRSKKSEGCFIVTVCYGVESNEVKVFRGWRDNYLEKRKFGKYIINLYYYMGPHAAEFISDKPLIKQSVKLVLHQIKRIIEK